MADTRSYFKYLMAVSLVSMEGPSFATRQGKKPFSLLEAQRATKKASLTNYLQTVDYIWYEQACSHFRACQTTPVLDTIGRGGSVQNQQCK